MVALNLPNDLSKSLDDEEIEKLSDILDSFPNEMAMSLEMLDGFFTALNCCPKMILPSAFLHRVWGDETGEEISPFEDEAELQTFVGLTLRYWNDVGDRLRSGEFEALLEDVPDVGFGWALGFLFGVELSDNTLAPMMNDEEAGMAFFPIFALAFECDEHPETRFLEEEMTPEMREELLPGLSIGAMAIYNYFHGTQKNNFQRPTSKVGRNDPCPCNSGKKYKKCCADRATR